MAAIHVRLDYDNNCIIDRSCILWYGNGMVNSSSYEIQSCIWEIVVKEPKGKGAWKTSKNAKTWHGQILNVMIIVSHDIAVASKEYRSEKKDWIWGKHEVASFHF